jgi:protein-L-isoaspartate(D-aspartate) O-methyltransferase
MAEAVELKPTDKVLEVGTGSGYAAAVFAQLVAQVCTIERYPSLAAKAKETLSRLGYTNIEVRSGDGTRGWPEAAPFDAIIVAASGPRVPEPLKQQLAIGGRIVMPVGGGRPQLLYKVTRLSGSQFAEESLGPVQFVLLIGDEGWADVRDL